MGGVEARIGAVESRIDTLDANSETLDMKMELANKRVGQAQKELQGAVARSREDTIEVLSELIHAGHDRHEQRIEKIEDHLHLPRSA